MPVRFHSLFLLASVLWPEGMTPCSRGILKVTMVTRPRRAPLSGLGEKPAGRLGLLPTLALASSLHGLSQTWAQHMGSEIPGSSHSQPLTVQASGKQHKDQLQGIWEVALTVSSLGLCPQLTGIRLWLTDLADSC